MHAAQVQPVAWLPEVATEADDPVVTRLGAKAGLVVKAEAEPTERQNAVTVVVVKRMTYI